MKIVAVDPGKLCGVFRVLDNLGIYTAVELPPYETVRTVESWVKTWCSDDAVEIVVERYTITGQRMTPQYDALETIGALRYVATKWNAKFTLQSRADKSTIDNAMLRRISWYRATRDGHANDAARHALLYLIRHHPTHPIVRLAVGKMATMN